MKTLSETEVRKMLERAITEAGGQRAFGELHGVSGQHVGRVLSGEKLSPAVLAALGLKIASTVTRYERVK